MKIKSRKLPGEVWREIYGIYAISNLGRWYSSVTQKIIKQHKNTSGYYRVCIYINGNRKWVFTHINVVKTFGDCRNRTIPDEVSSLFEKGLSIDHIDGIKKHNGVSNLELVTHSENCIRRSRKYAKYN